MTDFFLALLLLAGFMALGGGWSPAAAWGPGMHIHLGRSLLQRLRRSPKPSVEQQLVLYHPDHFYYGNIAADIINFKNFGGIKNNCHNWNIHERLLSEVTTDTERAFVLGYLCHLAADVIAHNHFVPFHLLHKLPPRYLGHPYWEAVADGTVGDEDWNIIAALKRNRRLRRNDRLIHRAVRRKALGMRSNKWIFNNITLISLRKAWREFIRKAHQRERRYPLHGEFFKACWTRCFEDMLKVFDADQLLILKLQDPTGRGALRGALHLRRELLRHHPDAAEARRYSIPMAHTVYYAFFPSSVEKR
ncbi:MAG: zinc dependent phospholipase C family protein [Planctomycetes bacterium]|nr:zinc dependent phospholipase C family protein [Planctomycetota bacterium]